MFEFLEDTTATGIWCMILACAGAVLFGFDNGWWGTIQGAEAFLRDFGTCEVIDGVETCDISTAQRSAGSSVQSAGIMVGSILSVYINRRLGRRMALVAAGIISVIGVIIELTSAVPSARFSQFVAGKAIASISMGMVANIVPIYLSETSTARARGFTISMYQNILIIGFLVAISAVYGSAQRKDSAAYYIPLALQLIAPLVMIALSPRLPESPRWLVWNGRSEEAIESAKRLFATEKNNFDAVQYVRELEVALDHEKNVDKPGWLDLVRQPTLRRLLISVGAQCFLQAQGSSYITNYYVSFLRDQGITDPFPYILGINIVYYAGILTGHWFPDRYGRRPTFISSTLICGIFMLIATTVGVTGASGVVSMVFNFLWQLANGVMSPLVWIICTEAAPTGNREKVLSLAIFISFGVALLITSCSPYIQDKGYGNLGRSIGYIWGGFSVITSVWAYFMVPETKGISLEQLDFLYEKRTPTRVFRHHKFSHAVVADEVAKEGDDVEAFNVEEPGVKRE
ncbi:Major facilitator-type transporter ecdD [Paramyrothecium foliicola]|nr:Major facilitator-type transporter ecdD [Paramyrothecium foliicola]